MDHQEKLLSSKSKEMQMSERVHESVSSETLTLQIELTEMENVKVIFMACGIYSFLNKKKMAKFLLV